MCRKQRSWVTVNCNGDWKHGIHEIVSYYYIKVSLPKQSDHWRCFYPQWRKELLWHWVLIFPTVCKWDCSRIWNRCLLTNPLWIFPLDALLGISTWIFVFINIAALWLCQLLMSCCLFRIYRVRLLLIAVLLHKLLWKKCTGIRSNLMLSLREELQCTFMICC